MGEEKPPVRELRRRKWTWHPRTKHGEKGFLTFKLLPVVPVRITVRAVISKVGKANKERLIIILTRHPPPTRLPALPSSFYFYFIYGFHISFSFLFMLKVGEREEGERERERYPRVFKFYSFLIKTTTTHNT